MEPQTPRPDTPVAARLYHSLRSNDLGDKRKALQNDLRHKTEVSLDEFIEIFVPKLPEGLEVTSNFAKQITKTQAWSDFFPPSSAQGNEDTVFKRLMAIFKKMVSKAQSHWGSRCPSQQWSLITAPTSTPVIPERVSTFKPDGYFYRTTSQETASYSYYDMAFPAEFKKRSNNTNVVSVDPASSILFVPPTIRSQDTSKVLYAMRHMMAVDARRRFLFGLTIENTSLTLWYTNHSMLVSSIPLDISQDKRCFFQVLLSFAFASDVDMGFNQSIELVQQHGQDNFYCMAVGDTKYETGKVLYDIGADYLLGRAARVFEVKKVGDPEDNIYVLKDLWPEEDQKPEHKIYDDITHNIDNLYPSSEHGAMVRRHLFTPVDYAFVKVNGVRDNTKTIMMRNKTLVTSNVTHLPTTAVSSCNCQEYPTSFPTFSDRDINPIYDTMRNMRASEKTCYRLHYRIVFKERAKPLHKVGNLGEVFTVLADLMKLFRILHKCGWVHRDISAGNVYLYQERGVLGDLEFAKNTADTSQHEVRTGTIDFMPVEIIAQRFLFLPYYGPETKFRYNALHDIESAWWLGVWMMFFFMPDGHEESSQSSYIRQDQTLRLFPGTLSFDSRCLILRGDFEFIQSIRPWIAEVSVPAVQILDDVRILVLQLYKDLEMIFPNNLPMLSSQADPASNNVFPGGPVHDIYEPIIALFLEAKRGHNEITLVPFKVTRR